MFLRKVIRSIAVFIFSLHSSALILCNFRSSMRVCRFYGCLPFDLDALDVVHASDTFRRCGGSGRDPD